MIFYTCFLSLYSTARCRGISSSFVRSTYNLYGVKAIVIIIIIVIVIIIVMITIL